MGLSKKTKMSGGKLLGKKDVCQALKTNFCPGTMLLMHYDVHGS